MLTHTNVPIEELKVPHTTLFLLQSLDGKISTGASDIFDIDSDIPHLPHASKGLGQFYDAKAETDSWSMVSGKTLAKLGINETLDALKYIKGLHRVIIGTSQLTKDGIENIIRQSESVVFIVTDERLNEHVRVARLTRKYDNAAEFCVPKDNLEEAFLFLNSLGCEKITIQTGGTVNASLIKQKLIDDVDVTIAPILVGGKNTPSLVDGDDRETIDDLSTIGEMWMTGCESLRHSYLRVKYSVIK